MKKLFAILLLLTVTCFADNKFVSGKFVSGAMPYLYVAPTNGLLNGLIAYYKMDETINGGSTNAAAPAGQPNNWILSDYSNPTLTTSFGRINRGKKFIAGTSSQTGLITAYSTNLTTAFTVGGWFYTDGNNWGNDGYILNLNTTGGYLAILSSAAEGQFEFYYGNLLYFYPNYSAWNYVAIVADSSNFTLTFYFNGEQLAQADGLSFPLTVGDWGNSSADFAIGTDQYGNTFGGGATTDNNYIDEWGLWNRALSQDEITKLYNTGNGYPYGAFTR
jgi:hypothetical protein